MNKETPATTPSVGTSPVVDHPAGDAVDGTEVNLPQPSLAVQFTSTEHLELTITNTALQVSILILFNL